MGFNINVVIAGRSHPLIVKDTQEEEALRIAAQKVNDLVLQFQQDYEKDKQDVLAMVALQFAFNVGMNNLQDEEKKYKELKTIKNLTKLIDKYL